MKPVIIALFGLAALASSARASGILTVTLTLNPPDGFISGDPGGATGWGYDLSTNDDYVTIEYLGFDDLTPVGTQNLLPPPSTGATAGNDIVVPFVAGVSGFEYDIDPAAVVGSSTSGGIYVVYDAYTDSTESDQIVFGQTLYATDGGNPVTAELLVTPEPGGLLLFVGAALR